MYSTEEDRSQNQVRFIELQKEQFCGVQEARTGLQCGLSADARVHTTGLESSVWGQVRAKAKLRSNWGIKAETPDRADGGQCYSWTLATNITSPPRSGQKVEQDWHRSRTGLAHIIHCSGFINSLPQPVPALGTQPGRVTPEIQKPDHRRREPGGGG